MTGVASLVFFFLDPSKAAIGAAEVQDPLEPLVSPDVIERAEALASDGGPNSYAVIYRQVPIPARKLCGNRADSASS